MSTPKRPAKVTPDGWAGNYAVALKLAQSNGMPTIAMCCTATCSYCKAVKAGPLPAFTSVAQERRWNLLYIENSDAQFNGLVAGVPIVLPVFSVLLPGTNRFGFPAFGLVGSRFTWRGQDPLALFVEVQRRINKAG